VIKTDAIELFYYNNLYFLFSINTCHAFTISKEAYGILSSIKKRGKTLKELEKEYGSDVVQNVVSEFKILQSNGYVGEKLLDFDKIAREKVSSLISSEPIIHVEGNIMIAQDCPMSCAYCYGGRSGTFNNKGFMSKDTAEAALNYLLKSSQVVSVLKVVFLGGEPLLKFDVIKHVVEKYKSIKNRFKQKVFFSFTTNGILITKEIAEYCKKEEINITVSIDGPKEIHDKYRLTAEKKGTFEKVMKGVEILQKCGIKSSTRTTVTNPSDLKAIADFFKGKDFGTNYIMPVNFPTTQKKNPFDLDLEDFIELNKNQKEILLRGCSDIAQKKVDSFESQQLSITYRNVNRYHAPACFRCGAGSSLIAIDIEGNLYPCHRFVGMKNFRLGNIYHGLEKDRVLRFYNNFLEVSKKCRSCWSINLCRRQCFWMKANEDGTFYEVPEEICEMYKENNKLSVSLIKIAQQENPGFFKNYKKTLDRYETDRMMEELLESKNNQKN
jgi:uncharacterized protein